MLSIFLQAAPENINIDAIRQKIENMDHVDSAHHVHVWSLDGENTVFSAHLLADKNLAPHQYAELKQKVKELIRDYGLHHSTVEIELPDEGCRMSENDTCNWKYRWSMFYEAGDMIIIWNLQEILWLLENEM